MLQGNKTGKKGGGRENGEGGGGGRGKEKYLCVKRKQQKKTFQVG